MNKASLAPLLALTLAAAVARADGNPTPPSSQVVNVQGVLRNSAGALQSAAFGLDVALYPTAMGGSAFFTQHLPTVPVENGYFSIELSGATLNFSGAPDAWVEVQVAGDSGPLPRMHLSAVPYALQCTNAASAGNAAQLGGQAAAYYVDTATDQTIAGAKTFSGTVNVAGKLGIGTGDPQAALDVRGDILLNGASTSTTINVRALVPWTAAAKFCPAGSLLTYTPRSYIGKTGAQICADDNPSGGQKHTGCVGAITIWVAADNTYGGYAPADINCSTPIGYPWPWGMDYERPDTTQNEWAHGNTWAVCCK